MTTAAELARAVRQVFWDTMDRVPVSVLADENTDTLVDNGTDDRWGDRRVEARFKAGKWVRPNGSPLAFEPTFWLRFKK